MRSCRVGMVSGACQRASGGGTRVTDVPQKAHRQSPLRGYTEGHLDSLFVFIMHSSELCWLVINHNVSLRGGQVGSEAGSHWSGDGRSGAEEHLCADSALNPRSVLWLDSSKPTPSPTGPPRARSEDAFCLFGR